MRQNKNADCHGAFLFGLAQRCGNFRRPSCAPESELYHVTGLAPLEGFEQVIEAFHLFAVHRSNYVTNDKSAVRRTREGADTRSRGWAARNDADYDDTIGQAKWFADRRRRHFDAERRTNEAPSRMRRGTTRLTSSTGIAKPMPALAPLGLKIAVFTPIRRPAESNKGPPELPGLIAASV